MNAYSEKQGQNVDSLRFFFDNTRIQKTDTPASLDMEEDDSIDVHQQQLGGDGSPDAAVCRISFSAPLANLSQSRNFLIQSNSQCLRSVWTMNADFEVFQAESKPEEDGQATYLNVKVKDQNNNELFFKIKRTTVCKS
jgi:hypothetical protein